MKRQPFLAGLASSAIAPFAMTAARAASRFAFSGMLGVYAVFLDDEQPFAQERSGVAFSSASVIKLLIAVGAMRKMANDGVTLEDAVVIPGGDIVGASETFATAVPGSQTTLRALMTAMIAQSDNTAANALLDWVGEKNLNALAWELGLGETILQRHFMDLAAKAAGHDNLTSPHDMAALAKGIALGMDSGYGGATPSGCRFIYEQMLRQEDRELIPAAIARPATIANKTGELVGVRHDVAIVDFGKPRAYAVALLSEDWTSRSEATVQLRAVAARVDALAQRTTP